MRYNELTYHKANPFYKQDFLPDRAWFNRQARAYPSQIPSGKDFLPNDGRKHFTNKFNHSEIEENGVLKSVEKYPYEHRIALDKTYQRSLLTIDIEGASSNTKMNQSIKNKLRARDEIARKYNQSVQSKQKTEQERRRQIALQIYQSNQERRYQSNEKMNSSRLSSNNDNNYNNYDSTRSNNPEHSSPNLKKDLTNEYKQYVMQNSSNKYTKDIPQPQYNQFSRVASYNNRPERYSEQQTYNEQPISYQNYENPSPRMRSDSSHNKQGVAGLTTPVLSHLSGYKNQFDADMMRKNEQYQKILQYEEMSKRMMQNPRQVRKSNPTNLSSSINMAGQSIVSG